VANRLWVTPILIVTRHTLHHPANNREWVTLHTLLFPGSLTTFHPMTAGSEWHCSFCFCQAVSLYHHMTNSQWVPLLMLFLPSSFICILWLTECQWYTCDMSGRLTVFYLVTHRLWVVQATLLDYSTFILHTTACEQHYMYIFSDRLITFDSHQ
jgi:hypothetical protein